MNNVKVSIIVPIYNVEKYVKQCLDSLVNQTLQDIEIICINDDTPDTSFEIAKKYAVSDPRIVLLELAENSGQGIARNKGIEIASGQYVMFCDPDDYFEPEACAKAYTEISKNKNDIVFYNYLCDEGIHSRINKKRKNFIHSLENNQHILLGSGIIPFLGGVSWSQIYSRNFLLNNQIKFSSHRFAEDLQFVVMCYTANADAGFLNEALYHYRVKLQHSVVDYSKIFDQCIATASNALQLIEKSLYADALKVNFLKYIIARDLYFFKSFSKNNPASSAENFCHLRRHFKNLKNKKITGLPEKTALDYNCVVNSQSLTEFKYRRTIEKIFSKVPHFFRNALLCLKFKCFLEKFVHKEQSFKHIIYNISGIKISIKRSDSKVLHDFPNHIPDARTILVIEPNSVHYECLPGLYSYIKALGYNCEIMTIAPAAASDALVRQEKVKIWNTYRNDFLHFMKYGDFSRYHCLFFNSKRIYWMKNGINDDGTDIEPLMTCIPGKYPTIFMQHHLEYANKSCDHEVCLANPGNMSQWQKKEVNVHDFGNVNITPKNKDTTIFITVGELSIKRKNHSLLIDAVKDLHNSGIRNFKIIVIGKGKVCNIPRELHRYFLFLGRCSYSILYSALEEADFFLPLLDPQIPEHSRYMKYCTSGSFQLIYGFAKPCLLHKTFADIYKFYEKDSLIYEDNKFLAKSMKQAIDLPAYKYDLMQDSLTKTAHKIYESSKYNLSTILNEKL